jgi:hypothetical protein
VGDSLPRLGIRQLGPGLIRVDGWRLIAKALIPGRTEVRVGEELGADALDTPRSLAKVPSVALRTSIGRSAETKVKVERWDELRKSEVKSKRKRPCGSPIPAMCPLGNAEILS